MCAALRRHQMEKKGKRVWEERWKSGCKRRKYFIHSRRYQNANGKSKRIEQPAKDRSLTWTCSSNSLLLSSKAEDSGRIAAAFEPFHWTFFELDLGEKLELGAFLVLLEAVAERPPIELSACCTYCCNCWLSSIFECMCLWTVTF